MRVPAAVRTVAGLFAAAQASANVHTNAISTFLITVKTDEWRMGSSRR